MSASRDHSDTPDEGASSRAFNRKWGHNSFISTTAQQRHAIDDSFTLGRAPGFGRTSDGNSSCVCVHAEYDDNDDPFASIVDFLDRREKELNLKSENVSKRHAAAPGSQGDVGYSHSQNRRDNCGASYPKPLEKTCNFDYPISSDFRDPTPARIPTGYEKSHKDIKDSTSPDNSRPPIISQSSCRKRQYTVLKSTTPRFTFSRKPKNHFITPSAKKSLPSRVLFPESSSTVSSKKRQKRHTFRPTAEVCVNAMPPTISNNRNEDFVPSFMTRFGKSSSVSNASKEELLQDDAEDFNLVTSNKLLREGSKYAKSTLRGSKRDLNSSSGYLTKRLHSLRVNDQMMNMRLHSGKLSTSSLIPRARCYGGVNATSLRNVATTVLDVTVGGYINIGCAKLSIFGDSRRAAMAYIHTYKTILTENEELTSRIQFPCFSWIVLSLDLLQKKGVSDARPMQLRIYDAIIITPRSEDKDPKGKIPTIICTHVYEEYPDELPPLPMVSFDSRSYASNLNF